MTYKISQPPPHSCRSSSCLGLTGPSGQKESQSTKITHQFDPKLCSPGNWKVTSRVWPPQSSHPEPARKALTSPRHQISPTTVSIPASPNLPVNLTYQRGRRSLPHVSGEGIYPPQAQSNRSPSPPPTSQITHFTREQKADSVCICPIHQTAARTPAKQHHQHHRPTPEFCAQPNSQPKPRPRKQPSKPENLKRKSLLPSTPNAPKSCHCPARNPFPDSQTPSLAPSKSSKNRVRKPDD